MNKQRNTRFRRPHLMTYGYVILVMVLLVQLGPFEVVRATSAAAPQATHLNYLPLTWRREAGVQVGSNRLRWDVAAQVDQQVAAYSSYCRGTSLGLVYAGKVVYLKTYGSHRIDQSHQWGSVSKTATALLAMQLVEQGRMDLGTPIWNYAPRYYDMIPAQYRSTPLTLQHLLTHMGGISHLENGNTPQMFIDVPGANYHYSSNSFNIVGELVATVLQTNYPAALKSGISNRVGANSLTAPMSWYSPGGTIESNIEDLSRYVVGVMSNLFVTPNTLYGQMLQYYVPSYGQGLGFHVSGSGDNIVAYHSGSLGVPRTQIYIKPKLDRGVALFCDAAYSWGDRPMYRLSQSLDSLLATSGNPCQNPGECPGTIQALSEPPSATQPVPAPDPELLPDRE